MSRKGWIYTPDGRVIEKGSPAHEAYLGDSTGAAPFIAPDEGEFISPIDRKVYSGRAGMREHNRRHDVINNRDLTGLPVGINSSGKGKTLSTRERQELRTNIYQSALRKGYLEGQ